MSAELHNERLLAISRFAEAYNRHDADAIMSLMSEECEFLGYTGPEPWGERFTGRSEVRKRVVAGLERLTGARWDNATHHVTGDRGFSEWTFVHPQPDGTQLRRDGLDVFRFSAGTAEIASKSTFQKWVIHDVEREPR